MTISILSLSPTGAYKNSQMRGRGTGVGGVAVGSRQLAITSHQSDAGWNPASGGGGSWMQPITSHQILFLPLRSPRSFDYTQDKLLRFISFDCHCHCHCYRQPPLLPIKSCYPVKFSNLQYSIFNFFNILCVPSPGSPLAAGLGAGHALRFNSLLFFPADCHPATLRYARLDAGQAGQAAIDSHSLLLSPLFSLRPWRPVGPSEGGLCGSILFSLFPANCQLPLPLLLHQPLTPSPKFQAPSLKPLASSSLSASSAVFPSLSFLFATLASWRFVFFSFPPADCHPATLRYARLDAGQAGQAAIDSHSLLLSPLFSLRPWRPVGPSEGGLCGSILFSFFLPLPLLLPLLPKPPRQIIPTCPVSRL